MLDQTSHAVRGQSSTRGKHNATLHLVLEKVLRVVGGVASSENTREHHQRMLITKSNELKSKVSELLTLLGNDRGEKLEEEPVKIKECVSNSKEIAAQLRKQVCHG